MGLNIRDIIPRRELNIEELKGKIVSVDAFNTIYQFLSTIRQPDGTPLMDNKKRITSHLSGLFYRNINLLSEGIKLIYAFDGKPPELKYKTWEKRGAVRACFIGRTITEFLGGTVTATAFCLPARIPFKILISPERSRGVVVDVVVPATVPPPPPGKIQFPAPPPPPPGETMIVPPPPPQPPVPLTVTVTESVALFPAASYTVRVTA